MNRQFLEFYSNELRHIRERAGEFASEYPKIAARLALDREGKQTCPDPFVERLLEGFAFLTARVQLKFDAEFPVFTQGMMETIYPHYLAPIPAMGIVRFEPNFNDKSLLQGVKIPRFTNIEGLKNKDEKTVCSFRTAHEISLFPFDISDAHYLVRNLSETALTAHYPEMRAALRLRMQIVGDPNGSFNKIACEALPIFLRGEDSLPYNVIEQLIAHTVAIIIREPGDNLQKRSTFLDKKNLRQMGFAENEAMLPPSPRSFEGYRILREHFSFPQRNLFFEISGLRDAFAKLSGKIAEIIFVLKERHNDLQDFVKPELFKLYCTPIVNLFSKRTDRVLLNNRLSEYHLIVDRTRTLDYEIFEIEEIIGHGLKSGEEEKFNPFYLNQDHVGHSQAFYTVKREQRTLSERERRFGAHGNYPGSEVFISLVDPNCTPFSPKLEQLSAKALCTNRHLPIAMTIGAGNTDFNMSGASGLSGIRLVTRLIPPRPSFANGPFAWRLISHLALNYHSLLDNGTEGASALRELLRLYVVDENGRLEVDGLRSIESKPLVMRSPIKGPVSFVKGIDISITFDDKCFEGAGFFPLASVIEQFLARYVSINSFIRLTIKSERRGEIMSWPVRMGKIHIL